MRIENLEKIVTLIEKSNKKICLFLGAGTDISSGGKLFSTLKKETINNFSDYMADGLSPQEIDNVFEEIIDSEKHSREILLESVNANGAQTVSDGYKLMALMAKYGFIETIITTNFFDYLEKTEKNIGESIFDYYINDKALNSADVDNLRNMPKYLKIHGDAKHFYISHVTNEEIKNKTYSERVNNLIVNSLKNNIVIFLGYSGSDDKLTEIFISKILDIDKVYWINPNLNKDSILIQNLIENDKIIYNDSTFDNFIIKLGLRYLSNIKLDDSHPILISSLLQANTKLSTKELLSISGPNIERDEYSALKILKKINIIIGKKGIGKTYLLKYFIEHSYNIQTLYLDLKYEEKTKILNELISSFGFVSETPFSLLYNICSWYNSQKQHLVFILDGINAHNKESINELISFIAATKRLSNIYFVISTYDEGIISNIKKIFEKPDYQIIKMSGFTTNNVEDMALVLNVKNFTNIFDTKLLSEPYICSLLLNYHRDKPLEYNCNIFGVIEGFLAEHFNINPLSLHEELITIAKNEYENITETSLSSGDVLASLDLIDTEESIRFKYDNFREYYLNCYLFRNNVEKTKQKNKLYNSLKNNQLLDEQLYKAYICYFSFIKTDEEAVKRLLELNELLQQTNNEWAIYFVRVCLDKIFLSQEKILFDVFNKISFSALCYELKRLIVEMVQSLENDDYAYILLKKFQDTNSFVYEISIYSIDRFVEKIQWFSKLSEATSYYDKYKNFVFSGTPESKILKHLYVLMRLDSYNELNRVFSSHIICKINEMKNECDPKKLVTLLSKYAYNILFNSDNDLEAKFNAISYEHELISIIEHVNAGNALTVNQYKYLIYLTDDIDNMFIFLVSNLIVVQSMMVDYTYTLSLAKKIITDENSLKPQNIDFIISSVFMSLYHIDPQNRSDFVSFFDDVYQKFEMCLFEQPTNQRTSTAKKFSDEFSKVFEDGFNPLAILFYTSIIENPNERLNQYWTMCECLSSSGNISKILKIVHAVGQMISLYPREGFEELSKACNYNHEIIKKGILRVMQESLVRYPTHTKNFIENSEIFTKKDLIFLYGQVNESFTNRTLEQLHWSRLFFSIKLTDPSIVKNILNLFRETNSLTSFIQDLFYQNNL